MKQLLAVQHGGRRSGIFRSQAAVLDGGIAAASEGGSLKSPAAVFWIVLHAICCLVSLVLGFRFSHLVFFLLFSPAATTTTTNTGFTSSALILHAATTTSAAATTKPFTAAGVDLAISSTNLTESRVAVGRHGILIRAWPHPDPAEVMRAHRIMERVQQEQRAQHGARSPRSVIAVTPTYARTFQALHLTGLMHTLMLLRDRGIKLTWIVVEAGGATNETKSIITRSGVSSVLHIPFHEKIPAEWEERHRMEARMRLHALRIVRERRLDGIVVFADDSNMHSLELFDEIQSVKWMGALSVGILAHSGNAEALQGEAKDAAPLPIQGPACNSSNQLAGWHTFNSLPYANKGAKYVGDGGMVLPRKIEWAGFVLNSRLVWKDAEGKPDWVRDLDAVGEDGEDVESPLALLLDASFVEPLSNCGKKVLLWWLRAEARSDSKFPAGWTIETPLEIIVPARRTPWPDAAHRRLSDKLPADGLVAADNPPPKTRKPSRPRRSSRKGKRGTETQ